MKFYGKSEEVAQMMIETFKAGNLPQALAPMFIHRNDAIPCRAWSWNNQLITALAGTFDARGFQQWKDAGRSVKKGARSFHILGPILKTFRTADKKTADKTTNDTEAVDAAYQALIGFKSIPVFRLEDTEITNPEKWTDQVDTEEEARLKALPFREVADFWGLNITSYNGRNTGAKGYYTGSGTVAVGVKNLATWTHELIHAADDKNGTIKKAAGQDPGNEIVAELGGAILLTLAGEHVEADIGGAWEYIRSYAGDNKDKALSKIMSLIDRTCKAVDLVLTAAEQISANAQNASAPQEAAHATA